ncbi:protein translocase subunit SecD [Candidatus Acetothermia bacterium]|nr:protein translocase subunit SecD [Candidatus Acetothermia bacterium]
MNQQVVYNWLRLGALALVSIISIFFFWPREGGQLAWPFTDDGGLRQPNVNLGLDLRGGCMLTVQLDIPPDAPQDKKDQLLSQTLVVVENRINGLGLTEPIISAVGSDRVLIQLPGAKDTELCQQIVNIQGQLEFKIVIKSSSVEGELKTADLRQEILKSRECYIPKLKDNCQEYLVDTEPLLTGSALEPGKQQMVVTTPSPSNPSPIVVSLTFNQEGAQKFRDAVVKVGPDTAQDAKRLAIVLDKQVYSAPVIRADLYNEAKNGKLIRQAQITGKFTVDEGKLLASVLNAGALPTKLTTIQNATVGPSLGQDSIEKGLSSTLIAGALILLFMVIYYRLSGIIADFTMVLNIVVLLGALSLLGATLTLPGIAGIILTIGMGVDSNVLIFERMREELKTGKPARAAIDAGYDRALTTIIDSHVTTLLTGLILFMFGTGPIRGFAITLCMGITINLFTALVGTRMCFEFLKIRRIQRLSI